MPDDRPNVLLITSDEHSFRCFSHLDPEGRGEPVHTPTLDSLAESSAAFDQTYCQVPLCTPSRMCMLTGLEQQDCGGWNNQSVLRPGIPTLPGVLSEAGYETAIVGKLHFDGSRQFAGFDHRPFGDLTGIAGHQPDPLPFDAGRDPLPPDEDRRLSEPGVTEIPESLLQDSRVLDETVSFVREQEAGAPDRPWFVCASFSRPHDPWTAPRRHFSKYWPDGVTDPKIDRGGDAADHPFTEGIVDKMRDKGHYPEEIDDETVRRARAGYFACVDYLDEVIGDLLARLERTGALENTIVVYTSDHGELGGEHGMWYKRTYHEASARVPLFIQLPDHRTGDRPAARLDTPVSLADLFPTLCGLTGVSAPDDLDGADLSESVRGGENPERGPVVCDNLNASAGDGLEFRMVRDGRYKYVAFRDGPELLFDVDADPFEQRNLATDASGDAAAVLQRLRSFVDETMDFEAAVEKRERDAELHEEYSLDVRRGLGEDSFDGRNGEVANVYHMPDGRLIDADTPLYNPIEVTRTPEEDYDDWPGHSRPGETETETGDSGE